MTKRYASIDGRIVQHPEGEYVEWEDYHATEKELAASREKYRNLDRLMCAAIDEIAAVKAELAKLEGGAIDP